MNFKIAYHHRRMGRGTKTIGVIDLHTCLIDDVGWVSQENALPTLQYANVYFLAPVKKLTSYLTSISSF